MEGRSDYFSEIAYLRAFALLAVLISMYLPILVKWFPSAF